MSLQVWLGGVDAIIAVVNQHIKGIIMTLRFIHTADWHLGQLFHQHSRHYEHQQFLSWLLQQIEEQQPHALLIAGDVYDVVNPSSQSQKQLYHFLAQAHQKAPHMQTLMIAGNHDSGYRVEQVSPLLGKYNAKAVGIVEWIIDEQGNEQLNYEHLILPIYDESKQIIAWCIALPFLRAAEITGKNITAQDSREATEKVYELLIDEVNKRRTEHQAVILMSHTHLQGADETKESERPIIVGNQEALSVDKLNIQLLDYVALGHLHKPQKVKYDFVRYSGSPIPLSFSEVNYKHQVLLVEIDKTQQRQNYQVLEVPRSVPVLRIKGSLESVYQQLESLKQTNQPLEQRAFLEVRYHCTEVPPSDLAQQIERRIPEDSYRFVTLKRERDESQTNTPNGTSSKIHLEPPTPEQLFRHILKQQGYEIDEAMLADFHQICLEAQENLAEQNGTL